MAIEIECPLCGANVLLQPDASVVPHGGMVPCEFTRTAESPIPFERKVERKKVSGEKRHRAGPVEHHCEKCHRNVREGSDGKLKAHLRKGGRWCKGGVKPDPDLAQRVQKQLDRDRDRARARSTREQSKTGRRRKVDEYEQRDYPDRSVSVRAYSGGLPGSSRR